MQAARLRPRGSAADHRPVLDCSWTRREGGGADWGDQRGQRPPPEEVRQREEGGVVLPSFPNLLRFFHVVHV